MKIFALAKFSPLYPLYLKKLERDYHFESFTFGTGGANSNTSGFAGGGVPHLTSIKAAWNVLAALNLKLTGRFGSVIVKVTVTGANVPGVNAGMFTVAFVGVPTTVSERKPVPALT